MQFEAHRRHVLPGFHRTLRIDQSPLGEYIVRDNRWWEIVGVVDDILHADLTSDRQSTLCLPFYQKPPTLGARHAEVTRAVMASEARAIGIGIVAALALSALASRTIASFLFGVSPYPQAFIGATAALALVGLVASYLPARHTSQVNAIEALRAE